MRRWYEFLSLIPMMVALAGSPAAAQTQVEATISWDVLFFQNGVNPITGSPVQTQNFLKSQATCNQAPIAVPPGTIVNPQRIIVADPDNAGRDCVLGPNSAGTLTNLPLGLGMFSVSVAKGPTLSSARSAASNPFNHVVIPTEPPVPAYIKVVP